MSLVILIMSYDIREDEEQEVKLQEITELLVGAGYFRARIKGLLPFDKVVGGLTWCILNCAVDIDVDLLYHENSSIGKKIALTEKIVAVLPKMKCPHRIEPHQIQGLDFINIFPVIQWLVKKALETRAEREFFNRSYSLREFKKLTKKKIEISSVSKLVVEHNTEHQPKRKLQPIKPFNDKEAPLRVMLTLQEFKDGIKREGVENQDELGEESVNSMTEKKGKIKIDTNAISGILAKKSEELKNATSEYLEKVKQAKMRKEETVETLTREIEHLKKKQESISQRLEDESRNEGTVLIQKQEIESIIHRKDEEFLEAFEKIQSSTPDEHQESLTKMKKLITINEKLKKQELEFKNSCKKELEELQKRNEDAMSVIKALAAEAEGSQLNSEQKKDLQNKRRALAERTKMCLEIERKIDRIPSRSELAQYQRRFVELYGQMDGTQNETQNFFDMYNNLGQQLAAIEREINLMNSIQELFVTTAMRKQSNKFEVSTKEYWC